jgi:hypothetical protein
MSLKLHSPSNNAQRVNALGVAEAVHLLVGGLFTLLAGHSPLPTYRLLLGAGLSCQHPTPSTIHHRVSFMWNWETSYHPYNFELISRDAEKINF